MVSICIVLYMCSGDHGYIVYFSDVNTFWWDNTKPGLWTLDWTVDWTLDSIMDSISGLKF